MTAKTQMANMVSRHGVTIITTAVFLLAPIFVSAHGGKSHSGPSFSRLEALQEATQLYDRLVTSGKLGEAWEVGLEQVDISSRKGKTGAETMVSFTRSTGEPSTVFFFFDENGKYSGSNFTGK